MLDEKQIRAAMRDVDTIGGTRKRLYDGGGLTLEVSTQKGIARWAVKYRADGKERRHALGRYPSMSIKAARLAARDFKLRLAGGYQPHAEQAPDSQFAAVAEQWLFTNRKRLAARTIPGVERYLRNASEGGLGKLSVAAITTPQIVAMLRKFEDRPPTLKKVRVYTGVILDYAIATGLRTTANPCAPLVRRGVFSAPAPVRHHPAMPLKDIGPWLRKLQAAPFAVEVKMALRFAALTALRTNEVLGLRWGDVDGTTLTIPAERMKAKRPHTVLLSPQARAVLDALELVNATEPDGLVFPARGGVALSQMALSMALRRTYKGLATVHGFRSALSTWANGAGHNPLVVERVLAHVQGDKVAAAYNRQTWDAEARKVWSEWAQVIGA